MAKIQLCRDTAANWTASTKILLAGEIGVELVTSKFKIGNGSSIWSALAYQGTSIDLSNYVTKDLLKETIIKSTRAISSLAGGNYTLCRITVPAPDIATPAATPLRVNITAIGDSTEGQLHFEAVFSGEADGNAAAVVSDQLMVYTDKPYIQTATEECFIEVYIASYFVNVMTISVEDITISSEYDLNHLALAVLSATSTPPGELLTDITSIDGGTATS